MDYLERLKQIQELQKSTAPESQFPDVESTGQDNIDRQQVVNDAVKARRWSLVPQAIAGIGDTLSAANSVYGGPGTGGAQNNVNKLVAGNIADTSTQFEKGLTDSPDSDASKQYQNLLGKFLGKNPSSFAHMSASQIKEQIPAIEKLATMDNTKATKELTLATQLNSQENAAADRKINRDNLEQNRRSLDEDRDAKRALQEQQQLEGRVQKHSTEMQKANLPELVGTYNELQGVFTQGGDVAGIGAFDSHVPGALLSPEGVRNRTNLQQMANSLLKSRSGAAVSDQEYKRFLLELQAGNMPTEKAIKTHLGKMGQDAKTIIGQLESGLPTKALEEYKSHPGSVSSSDVKDPDALYSGTTDQETSAVPTVGSMYNGAKVKKVTRIK